MRIFVNPMSAHLEAQAETSPLTCKTLVTQQLNQDKIDKKKIGKVMENTLILQTNQLLNLLKYLDRLHYFRQFNLCFYLQAIILTTVFNVPPTCMLLSENALILLRTEIKLDLQVMQWKIMFSLAIQAHRFLLQSNIL